MADSKITALTAISTVDPTADPLVIVDVSDTSMAASGTTKKSTINQLLGSGGTATLAAATITGDLTTRTTGLTVNSSGVGIGTNSQSSFLGNSPKKLVIGDGTQTPALTLYGGSANVCGLYFADGTVGNQAYRGYVEYDHNTDSFGLGISGSLAMTLNATGLGVGVSPSYNIHARGTTNGRIQVEGASGFGMVFVQASSGNAAQLQLSSSGGTGRRYAVTSNSSGQFTIDDETGGVNRLIIDSSGNVISNVTGTAPTLATNSQMVFNLTSNTNLRISVRGTDGTTRTANITLA